MTAPPPDREVLELSDGVLLVRVLPGKGADIYAVIDLATGIDVLFKTPWGWRDPRLLPSGGDSRQEWLARYPGGWNLLVPNAGDERTQDGVLLGYHGEAAVAAWQVTASAPAAATLEVELLSAPLRIRRELRLADGALEVTDTVVNLSPDPVQVQMVQHPAFGAPFVDGASRISTGARTVIADAAAPGTVLAADGLGDWPWAPQPQGPPIDLRRVPPAESGRAVFAALTDFDEGWVEIASPTAGFGMRLDWDRQVLPHAWFWQECRSGAGYPWFRRAYSIAVEPANLLPGHGDVAGRPRGQGTVLAAGGTVRAQITLSRVELR